MNIKKGIAGVLIAIIFFSRLSAADEVNIVANVEVYPVSDREDMYFTLKYFLYVTNKGEKKIVIPTRKFIQRTTAGINSIYAVLQWDIAALAGIKLIYPSADYGVVTLNNGETALIQWHEIESSKERLNKVEVVYCVADTFADRYSCDRINISTIANIIWMSKKP